MSETTTHGQWVPATRIKQLKAIMGDQSWPAINDAHESRLTIYDQNTIESISGYNPELVFAF